jgi:hypothetical protein
MSIFYEIEFAKYILPYPRTRKLQILASSLPDEKIPIAEDMMRVFLKAVDVKRTSPDTKKQKTDSPKSRKSQK